MPRGPLPLAGLRFGRLLVLERADATESGYATWRCACDCGARVIASTKQLREHNRKSCGCLRRDNARLLAPAAIAASAKARTARAKRVTLAQAHPGLAAAVALGLALGIRPPPPATGRVHVLADE